ncbi:ComEC/Rec2 family competence protein [Candidatus Uhrbacteria bacterium]|nr:ComEC/Rec2 family competence protein [Candidatus Uhrbacteria bacterium]
MPLHLVLFIISLSFVSGIAFASIGISLLVTLIPAACVFTVFFYTNTPLKIAALSSVIFLVGHIYYSWDDYAYWHAVSRVPEEVEIQGMLTSDPRTDPERGYILRLTTDLGIFRITADTSQTYAYGDVLNVKGEVEKPTEKDTYLIKEHIVGDIEDAHVIRIESGRGLTIFSALSKLRNSIRTSFQRLLSIERAAFLSGAVLGINDDFSKEFLQELSLSGTRHLTAVSGQHISIIFAIVIAVCSSFLSRRSTFVATCLFVLLFAGLAGFQASVIRAALMGMIAGYAGVMGRMYAPHNAIALAVVFLLLFNPKILVYDIGFQLSFLAVLGIIYGMPLVRSLFRMQEGTGLLGWKDSFLVTLCAQLATAPLLMTFFQNFSFTSIIANVLILGVIPLIMVLGFFVAVLSFVFVPLAAFVSNIVAPFIDYVSLVIHVFARVSWQFNPQFGIFGALAYYCSVIAIVYAYHLKTKSFLRYEV